MEDTIIYVILFLPDEKLPQRAGVDYIWAEYSGKGK
jgi:hypothetical protein